MKASTSQSRSYSTSAPRSSMATQLTPSGNPKPINMEYPDGGPDHKFPLPDVASIPRTDHLKRRYDPVVDQVTKSLMRSGKLSQAQKVSFGSEQLSLISDWC